MHFEWAVLLRNSLRWPVWAEYLCTRATTKAHVRCSHVMDPEKYINIFENICMHEQRQAIRLLGLVVI